LTPRVARPMGRATRGVKGINLGENDELVGMVVADPDGFLLTVCEKGYGKRTPFGANTQAPVAGDQGPAEGGTAEGELPDEAEDTSSDSTSPAADSEAQAPASAMRYRKQRRGGKGLRDIRTSDRNGPVIGVVPVRDDDDIMLITTQSMVNRTHVHEIRIVGRNTQGVKIMGLDEGDTLAAVVRVPRVDTNGEEASAE